VIDDNRKCRFIIRLVKTKAAKLVYGGGMAKVSIRDVRKSYGSLEVIHGVDVEIADGEFVVLVGPSGCGKSTLLRMVAGLESITGGQIAIGNRVVNNLPPKERDIAMVFQSYALYPHMRVADNMAFALKLRKTDPATVAQRVKRAADILGLTPYLDRYPRQLSGGQRQRVAMGRAIVRDPQVFLFDEPLSNLDAKLRVQMRAEIKELHQRLQTTTLFVTHDQVEAMTMADKIVVMQDGHVEQIGAPLDLYDRPNNIFVAGFIGSPGMNLIKGRVQADGGLAVHANGIDLPIAGAHAVKAGQEVAYGIRPEHLELADDGFEARVVVVEPTGSETQVIFRIGDGDNDIVALFRERHGFAPGQTIRLRPRPDRAHLYDIGTGKRI
jgi:multiple sugar transport system ATP-binding protein